VKRKKADDFHIVADSESAIKGAGRRSSGSSKPPSHALKGLLPLLEREEAPAEEKENGVNL